MEDCIFCKIIDGKISAKKEFENDSIVIFHDITPQAPIHLLAIPKLHITSANDINQSNANLISEIFNNIPIITKSLGISESGYRIVNNCGTFGGQTVHHLHFHILGGRRLTWPPG
ncbi:histidine triad nucleotide-binding protein [Leptospira sp. 96542]|nr:histidine triad nucleotide-binding protein [Leptospira sp. 96542]